MIAHEFGHVLGSMHADALQCGSGVSDVGTTSTGQFSDSSCYIREYGDSTDIMGLSSYNKPVISSPFWDAKGLGTATDIRDLGVASGVKSYTLKPWGDTKLAYRAVKFSDPVSKEVYYLELRQPAGYDAYLASGPAGNRGVKVVQRGGATPSSSLALMPSTIPFSGSYATNHTWQAGSTFITHAGTRVTVNAVTATTATVTIDADLALHTKLQFSAGDLNGDGRPDMVSRETDGSLLLLPGLGGNKLGNAVRIGTGWNIFNMILGNGDFDGDGKTDIVARTSNGALWLYPGNGTGGFLARKQIGAGWEGFKRIIAPGDFNGDTRADLLVCAPTGRCGSTPETERAASLGSQTGRLRLAGFHRHHGGRRARHGPRPARPLQHRDRLPVPGQRNRGLPGTHHPGHRMGQHGADRRPGLHV